jgi:hypothetical protein
MIGWLHKLDDDSRRTSLNQASIKSGITPKAIEKDWWVTLVLQLLFSSKYTPYYAFKGGTSLSKGWGIIDRFSEDIDIALSSEAFGKKYIDNPSKTFVEQLRRAGCLFTSNEITNELKEQFVKLKISEQLYSIEVEAIKADMPDTDPQTIYVNYKSLFDPNPYLPDRVKIEFSVRSQREPNDSRQMHTLLNHYFPNEIYEEETFPVTTIQPNRTLIEKILLLHEEYNREDESKMRTYRMSRHYYDLFRIYQFSEYSKALDNNQFIEDIIQHRISYSRLRHFDYNTLCIGRISIIPSASVLTALQNDYEDMIKEMMYGYVPTFSEMMKTANEIQERFNQKL